MGYFPNGSSGEMYRELYCDNCLHDVNRNCQIWFAHLMTNYHDKYGEISEAGKVLEWIIPSDIKVGCKKCTMFIPLNQDRRKRIV